MKKSLIALAAALAAGGVYAQSSVTLYGIIDVGYADKSWKDNDGLGNAKSRGVQDGAVAGNRFGFRGVEDLGGGLRGEFLIEQGISTTSSTLTNQRTSNSGHQMDGLSQTANGLEGGRSSTSLNRQSYVGLSGGFGAVRLGYQYTNLYDMSTLSGYQLVSEGVHGGDSAHTWGQQFLGGTRANGITYISPRIAGGLTLKAQYGAAGDLNNFDSTVNGKRKQDRYSLMGQYAAGPLSVALAYTQYTTEAAAGTAGTTALVTTASAKYTGKLTQLGASYDFGVARIAGTYNTGKQDFDAATTTDVDLSSWQLGVRVPFGAAAFIAGYGKAKMETGATKNNDVTQWQVAVTYDLSKRTQGYIYYGQTKDDGAGGIATQAAWDKKTHVIAGVRHSF